MKNPTIVSTHFSYRIFHNVNNDTSKSDTFCKTLQATSQTGLLIYFGVFAMTDGIPFSEFINSSMDKVKAILSPTPTSFFK